MANRTTDKSEVDSPTPNPDYRVLQGIAEERVARNLQHVWQALGIAFLLFGFIGSLFIAWSSYRNHMENRMSSFEARLHALEFTLERLSDAERVSESLGVVVDSRSDDPLRTEDGETN